MDRNFPRALAAVLKHEGGFVNHPSDPGGATNRGITIATFRRYVNRKGTVADLKNISAKQVSDIYRRHYWDKVRADLLPSGLDYAVFDYAVNSGPTRAAKHLQEVLGVPQDGAVGPVTISAAARHPDPITALCDRRMRFLRSLRTWATFGRGWSARVLGVRQLAHELAGGAAQPTQPLPKPTDTAPGRPEPSSGKGRVNWIAIVIAAIAALGAAILKLIGVY